MRKGFYTIMWAQSFSSLADNALFVAAVELLRISHAPEWQRAALVPLFALFYVVLAPFVGVIADAFPKGQVMFASNAIKVLGCLLMLFGGHPLVAFAIVGLGAAAYSPAKYGILTELLPPSQLVMANGWIEGLTIASIILGVFLGGQLMGPHIAPHLLAFDLPLVDTGVNTPPQASICVEGFLYAIAAIFNLFIPRTRAVLQALPRSPMVMVRDFATCNARLWSDKLGQMTLATTTLFWGVSGNLRYIVLAWAAAALGYGTTQASSLVGVVAIGTAVGATLASFRMQLEDAPRVIVLGVWMGVLLIAMNFIHSLHIAAPFLMFLGGLGGFLVVPMNALLQHRGHKLMGAGRSIAVQNFNEQACILVLGAFYSALARFGLSAYQAITLFGLSVASIMWLIMRWYARTALAHGAEIRRQFEQSHYEDWS
jgi:MFS family permease